MPWMIISEMSIQFAAKAEHFSAYRAFMSSVALMQGLDVIP